MKLVCKICNQKKGVSKDRLQKLIKKYGSEDAVKSNYVCRSCRKNTKNDKVENASEEKQLELFPENEVELSEEDI